MTTDRTGERFLVGSSPSLAGVPNVAPTVPSSTWRRGRHSRIFGLFDCRKDHVPDLLLLVGKDVHVGQQRPSPQGRRVDNRQLNESSRVASLPARRAPVKPDSVSQRYARFAGSSALNDHSQLFRYSATGLISAGVDLRTVAGRTWMWWRR